MNLNSTWSALLESYNQFNNISFEGSTDVIAELNLPPDWFLWLVAILFFGNEPISSVEFARAMPFGLTNSLEERFASATEQGWFIPDGHGGYRPTEKGTNALRRMVKADSDVISPLRPIPDEHLQKILGYLTRIAGASLAAFEPPSKFIISHKRNNMHPGGDASINVLIVEYLNELEGYRTDSHIAVWQPHNVAGHAWNVLTWLWRNGASTLDKMYEELQYNDVPQEVYAQDLQELARRGWIEDNAGAYQVTVEGKRIRDEAEALTDQYFFAPWACLSESELEDLSNLAIQLCAGLKDTNEQ
jgi:hypothetical protein